MTATTIDRPGLLNLGNPFVRLVLSAVLAAALLATAFAVGRMTAPTRTITSRISVPFASPTAPFDVCHVGQAC